VQLETFFFLESQFLLQHVSAFAACYILILFVTDIDVFSDKKKIFGTLGFDLLSLSWLHNIFTVIYVLVKLIPISD
jgi:hypothetical protein